MRGEHKNCQHSHDIKSGALKTIVQQTCSEVSAEGRELELSNGGIWGLSHSEYIKHAEAAQNNLIHIGPEHINDGRPEKTLPSTTCARSTSRRLATVRHGLSLRSYLRGHPGARTARRRYHPGRDHPVITPQSICGPTQEGRHAVHAPGRPLLGHAHERLRPISSRPLRPHGQRWQDLGDLVQAGVAVAVIRQKCRTGGSQKKLNE